MVENWSSIYYTQSPINQLSIDDRFEDKDM